ncbi:MAG TPA: RNA polymerase sigma factor [Mucilaginibacter sp.]|jgi:RNA polymerase sigma factor (sigma-70 family)|nr:RNA polymerase sigma factor [Mucilaginibacter sp.]
MSKVIGYSDEELIKTLKKDHVSDLVIKHLYRNYYSGLSNYIRANQGSEQDAEDIFQEVIVSFIDVVKMDKFKGESSIKTFLYSLCRFTWLNELKRRNRVLQREEKYEGARDQEERDVSHLLAGREAKGTVMAMMDRLGEVCKKILVAFYYDDLPMKDILPLVDFQNEQVLRNKKYKCLKSLEQQLEENPDLALQFKNALTYGS